MPAHAAWSNFSIAGAKPADQSQLGFACMKTARFAINPYSSASTAIEW